MTEKCYICDAASELLPVEVFCEECDAFHNEKVCASCYKETNTKEKDEKPRPRIDTKELSFRQTLTLDEKILLSKERIVEWFDHWNGKVTVSFSGGKDSTVLLHLARSIYPEMKGVFVNSGIEFPEIVRFVRQTKNIVMLKPDLTFKQVIKKYGYPVVSKDQARAISRYRTAKNEKTKQYRLHGFPGGRKGMIAYKWQYLIKAPFKISDECCSVMKKNPLDRYENENGTHPMIGITVSDSNTRAKQYLQNGGCNAFDNTHPVSWPLSFWLNRDIWEYLKRFNVPYAEIYDKGEEKTGCIFCAFGLHLEGRPNRFERLKKSHPKQYRYCMETLKLADVLQWVNRQPDLPGVEP